MWVVGAKFLSTPVVLPEAASFSQIYTASVCLRKWLLSYVVGIKEQPHERMIFGTGMHRALARFNAGLRADDADKRHHDSLMEAFATSGLKEREGDAAALLQAHTAYALAKPYYPEKVEAHCSVLTADKEAVTRFRGYVDLVARRGDHEHVEDYKCVARPPEAAAADQSVQLVLYSVANGTDQAALVHLFTTRDGPQVRRSATRITPERVAGAANWLAGWERSLRQAAATNHWPRRTPDHNCTHCYLREICLEGKLDPKYETFKQIHGDPDA